MESSALELDLMNRLKDRLKLGHLPARIECFDNSHLFGKAPVSAMVVFDGGKPQKKAYRTFKIKTASINDDYASMAEVLTRRFTNTKKHGPVPDLLIVDGGKGQLNIALGILKEMGLDQTVDIIGIAKKDERKGEMQDKVYLKQRVNPVSFGREQHLLLFLQKIRDEAHRFVIAFHRKQMRRSFMHSVLDDIPGIGKKRKTELLRHFGDVRNIRKASLEDLAALPGMNRHVAGNLKDALSQ